MLMVHREHPSLKNLTGYWLIDRLSANWESDKQEIMQELTNLLE